MKAHQHLGDRTPVGAWRDATPPDLEAGRTTGRLRSCNYCGSMHPADLAVSIRSGAKVEWSDQKYGWPHKAYVDGIPNPHAGLLESRMSTSHAEPVCPKTGKVCESGRQSFSHPECACMKAGEPMEGLYGSRRVVRVPNGFSAVTGAAAFEWREEGQPADATTHGKFYTEHLQDADPEDREVIERAMGITFTFEASGRVTWSRIA